MEKIIINDCEYQLIKEYRDGYDQNELLNKVTDYFFEYDYIVGDWAYGKLRLKGFFEPNSKKVNSINNFDNVDDYLKNNCAFDCKYFIIKKVSN